MSLFDALRLAGNALLAPQTCGLCGVWVLNSRLIPLCDACKGRLIQPAEPSCYYCARPLPGHLEKTSSICSRCRHHPPPLWPVRCCGSYSGDLRELLHLYKFGFRRPLAWPLSEILQRGLEDSFPDLEFDWLVPVPSHPSRVRERGFDAVGLLAERLSERTGLPVFSGLARIRRTRPQFGLSREERRRNLKSAFDASPARGRLTGNILILDDVFTTGATIFGLASEIEVCCRSGRLGVLALARAGLWS